MRTGNIDFAKFSQAAVRLGETVLDPTIWPEVMQQMCASMNIRGAALLQGDVRTPDVPRTPAVSEPFDLAAPGATVTILGGLTEIRGAGELVMDHPLTLFAEARNTAKTARFKTAPGEAPAAEVTIGSRGRGQFTLALKVRRATLDRPDGCPRPELGTKIRIADGRHRPVEVAMEQVWQCIERGATVEYLRTP